MHCSLDIYTDYLSGPTGEATATGLSSLYDGAIHDQVTRLLTSSYVDFKDLWRKAKSLIRQTQTKLPQEELDMLIVDDSLVVEPHTHESALLVG